MSSKFKFTAPEIASLTVLTAVITAFAITLACKQCRHDCTQSDCAAQFSADSIASIVSMSKANPTDTTSSQKRIRTRKKPSSETSRQPKQRNYLDEKADE